MLIKLKEIDYKLIRRIEKANSTSYGILEIQGDYYINADELFSLIDDIQDNREYAEEKVIDLTEELNSRPEIDSYTMSIHDTMRDLEEENKILRKEIARVCNEDMLDRLAFEGVEI